MQDLMIDLETLGVDVDAPIISVGAAYFDIKTKQIGPTFYMVCDVADQLDSKIRFANSSTIKWWMGQSGAAKRVFKEGAKPTKEVLETLSKWILSNANSKSKTTKKVIPWGNGAGFDVTLMETLFRDFGVTCPWFYYNIMDLRTFKRFVARGEKVQKLEGIDHNALDDCINQINYIFKYSENLNNA